MNKIITLAITLLMLAGMLFAQPVDKVNPNVKTAPVAGMNENLIARPMPMDQPMDMMQMLDLDKTQQDKLSKLRDDFMKLMNTKRAELENLKIDLQNAIEKEDYAKAKNVTKQISDKKLEIAYARIDHMQAMMKELNAEQKEIAKKMFGRMHGRGHGMMQGCEQGMMHSRGKGMMRPGCGMGPCQGHMNGGGGMGMHQGDCEGDCEGMNAPMPGNMHHKQSNNSKPDMK